MSSIPDPITTNWVPLQGDSRERTIYWGAYEASRTYNDGDCALGLDGILYLCTKNGTNTAPITWPKSIGLQGIPGPQGLQGLGMPAPVVDGQWIKGVGGAAVWSQMTIADVPNIGVNATYGVSMPGIPVDGQEHILVDDVSAPTWNWRCRYNASATSIYKWEVIGTPLPLHATASGQFSMPLNAWTALSTTLIRVPRPGIYICQGSCRCYAANGGSNYFGLMYNNNPAAYFGPLPLYTSGSGLWGSCYIAPFQATFPNIGDTVGITGYCTLTPGYFDMESWSIKPVRIS
jgi:hypothetical protein